MARNVKLTAEQKAQRREKRRAAIEVEKAWHRERALRIQARKIKNRIGQAVLEAEREAKIDARRRRLEPFYNFKTAFVAKYTELVADRDKHWTGFIYIPREWVELTASRGPSFAYDRAVDLDSFVSQKPDFTAFHVFWNGEQFTETVPTSGKAIPLNLTDDPNAKDYVF